MRLKSFLTALFLLLPGAVQAQDTVAIKAALQGIDRDVDTIRKDKGRPSYSKRADARIDSVHVPEILRAMRVRLTPAPDTVVASVVIQSLKTSVAVGDTAQLYAIPKNAAGTVLPAAVSWGLTNTTVADLSATGLLTGKSAGDAAVTARAGGVAAARTYTVKAKTPVPPDTVKPPLPADTSKFDGIAELPRYIPKAEYNQCVRSIPVPAGANFQAAVNAALPGDCLNLAPDATYVGNFTLPDKGASTSWITIQTDPNVAATPPPGTRITPTIAAALRFAKIQADSYNEALKAAPGAHHYRFHGVEISTTPAAQPTGINELIEIIGNYKQHHFQFDQVYVHGTPTLDSRRLLRADAQYVVVVDGWWSEVHSNGSDSQCWLNIVGAKFVLYENNHCAAGHEPFMAGGGDPPDSTLQPSDITVRRNHFYRPPSWKGVWQVKNMLETKNVRRLLVEGNVVENSWPDAQAGFCFVLKSENQDGTAPWTTTSDVTVRYNIVKNCASGFNLSGKGSSSNPNITSARYSIHDNKIDTLAKFGGDGIDFQYLSQITDVNVFRNTATNGYPGNSNSAVVMDGPPAAIRLVMKNNIMGRGAYGIKGGGQAEGTASLEAYAPGYTFTNNVLVANWGYPAPPCSAYPASTVCASSFPPPSSTLGADPVKVAAWTQGVVVLDPLMSAALRSLGDIRIRHKASNPKCHSTVKYPLEAAKCDVPLKP